MPAKNDIHYQFAKYFTGNKDLQVYLYHLAYSMDQGHICINVDHGIPEEILQEFGYEHTPVFVLDTTLIGNEADTLFPFILYKNLLYTQRQFIYESDVVAFLRDRLHQVAPIPVSKEQWLSAFPLGEQGINWQFVAAFSALQSPLAFITGGPGTGKTTTVAKIISLLRSQHPNTKIALAAPTGKAAARLAESMHFAVSTMGQSQSDTYAPIPTFTIHRLLGTQKNSIYFKHHKEALLDYDLIVVDESSMIDLALFAKLLNAIPPNCRLLFLGDKNQLAAVEAGSLFGDLCELFVARNEYSSSFIKAIETVNEAYAARLASGHLAISSSLMTDKVVTLEQSYRFSDSDGIGILSKAVIGNDVAVLNYFLSVGSNNQVTWDGNLSTAVFHSFMEQFKHYLIDDNGNYRTSLDALLHLNHCIVLAANREGSDGVYNLNVRIEQYLIQKGYIKATGNWYNYKPIMVTENNYQYNIYNGDIGLLFEDKVEGVYKVHFLSRNDMGEFQERTVLLSFISSYETCFAMTIHKSQGSEFNHVLLTIPDQQEGKLLNRELLYTGLTRAKKSVLIQAKKESFLEACELKMERNSGLETRLK